MIRDRWRTEFLSLLSLFLPFRAYVGFRFWELERNTRNTFNSRVSKWALKFLVVKLAAANSRAVNSEFVFERRRERKEMLSRSLAGFKIHIDSHSPFPRKGKGA